jgi:protein-tyrosine phosphatase
MRCGGGHVRALACLCSADWNDREQRMSLINFRHLANLPHCAVYRAAELSRNTPAALSEAVHDHGLDLAIDLRTERERSRRQASPCIATEWVPVGDAHWRASVEPSPAGRARALRRLLDDHANQYVRVLELLASHAGTAAVVYCTTGKDRTGIAAMCVHALLGQPTDVIVRDYIASTVALTEHVRAFADKWQARKQSCEELLATWRTDPATVTELLAQINETHGGLSALLCSRGLEEATLARFTPVLNRSCDKCACS